MALGIAMAHAADPGPPLISQEKLGYAFNTPEILNLQEAFGLLQGVSILAAACLTDPEHGTAVENAFAEWYAKQAPTIQSTQLQLAQYYFGGRAEEARWSHIARILNLPEAVSLAPESEELRAACASFAEAVQQSRYDVSALLEAASEALRTSPEATSQVPPQVPPESVASPPETPTEEATK